MLIEKYRNRRNEAIGKSQENLNNKSIIFTVADGFIVSNLCMRLLIK